MSNRLKIKSVKAVEKQNQFHQKKLYKLPKNKICQSKIKHTLKYFQGNAISHERKIHEFHDNVQYTV